MVHWTQGEATHSAVEHESETKRRQRKQDRDERMQSRQTSVTVWKGTNLILASRFSSTQPCNIILNCTCTSYSLFTWGNLPARLYRYNNTTLDILVQLPRQTFFPPSIRIPFSSWVYIGFWKWIKQSWKKTLILENVSKWRITILPH